MNKHIAAKTLADLNAMLKKLALSGVFKQTDDYSQTSEPQESLYDELDRRFDVLVDMNEHHTVPKGDSIATYALGGCIAGYFDNPETSTLFHYSPLGASIINMLINQHSSSDTKLHLFVPGEWRLKDDQYEMIPKRDYTDRILLRALQNAKARGLDVQFHCYNELRRYGERYQGTAWIESNGDIYLDHKKVGESDKRENNLGTPALAI